MFLELADLTLGHFYLTSDALEILAQIVDRPCPIQVSQTSPVVTRADEMEVLGVVSSHLIEDDKAVDGRHAEIFQRFSFELLRLHFLRHERGEGSHCTLAYGGHVLKLLVPLFDHLVQPDAVLFHLYTLLSKMLMVSSSISTLTANGLLLSLNFP